MKNTKKAWLVRAYPHGKYRFNEFRENNIVAIGWPGIGSLEYKPLKEELDSILSGDPYNLKGIPRGLASSTITLFINSMNIDDYVLVPIDDNIYIGQIISDYKYQEDKDNICRDYYEKRVADIYSPKDADYYPTFCGAYLDDGSFIIADNFVELRAKAKAEGGYLRQAYVVRDSFWKHHRHDTYQQVMAALWDQETLAMRPMADHDLWAYMPKDENGFII